MDLFIRNIDALLKAAKNQDSNMINLIVAGATLGHQCGQISIEDNLLIAKVADRLLEDM